MFRICIFSLPLILFYFFSPAEISGLSAAPQSAECGPTKPCDSSRFLVCEHGKCACGNGSVMDYDLIDGGATYAPICMLRIGQRCGRTGMKCGTDAFCNAKRGVCEETRSHGEKCEGDKQCPRYQRLKCVRGICACADGEIFDATFSPYCYVKAGNRCADDAARNALDYYNCVSGAHCRRLKYGGWSHTCACSEGLEETPEGFCLANLGASCRYSKVVPTCRGDLVCGLKDTCECPLPEYLVYKDSRCYSELNYPCEDTSVDGKLVRFQCFDGKAECRSDNGIAQCLCKTGFIESTSGTCKASGGTACGTDFDCDSISGLKCKGGKCA